MYKKSITVDSSRKLILRGANVILIGLGLFITAIEIYSLYHKHSSLDISSLIIILFSLCIITSGIFGLIGKSGDFNFVALILAVITLILIYVPELTQFFLKDP